MQPPPAMAVAVAGAVGAVFEPRHRQNDRRPFYQPPVKAAAAAAAVAAAVEVRMPHQVQWNASHSSRLAVVVLPRRLRVGMRGESAIGGGAGLAVFRRHHHHRCRRRRCRRRGWGRTGRFRAANRHRRRAAVLVLLVGACYSVINWSSWPEEGRG